MHVTKEQIIVSLSEEDDWPRPPDRVADILYPSYQPRASVVVLEMVRRDEPTKEERESNIPSRIASELRLRIMAWIGIR